MTRTALLSLSHLALLGLASSRGLLGQGCTTGLPNHNPQGELVTTPFFGNVEVVPGTPVTLYVDEGLRNSPIITESRVREGANAWNNACSKRNIPRFELNWTGSRPQLTPGDSTSVAYRTSIQLKLIDTFAPPVQGHLDTYEMAFHSPADNTISIYSKCPQFTTAGFPCAGGRPGGAILWSTPGMFEAVLAHEIGHSLWLDHDRTGGSCGGGVMAANWQQGVPSAIRPEHCDLADAMNNANRKCNYADAEPGEQHPCEHDDGTTLDGDPGGPEGAGHGLAGLFCEEYPWLCRSRPPWPGGGISCQWACVSTTIDFSDTITDCSWVCGATPTGPSEAPPSPESLATNQGFGPHLAVKLPDPGSVVSGVITVQGFAMDFGGLGSVSFGVDGTETVLSQYSVGFRDDDACRLPLGLPHPRCLPNSGYSGRLDTRSLSNGPHTLQVVATDRFGWTTSAEIPFVVDNPTCETEQPTISLTAPANGATVSGTVPLAATASDNVGVSVVKFYADGSLLGSDTTSPYTGSWNAAAAAAGSHTLQARAWDGCANTRWSNLVTVNVPLPPPVPADLALFLAFDGSPVARGATVSLPPTQPLVSTSTRFRIANTGGEALSLANPTTLVSDPCFELAEVPLSPVAPGGETFFRVRLYCSQVGVRSTAVTILSNDPDESPYSFTVTGVVESPTPPEIAVSRAIDGLAITDGGSTSIGPTPVGVSTSVRYRIANTGTGNLDLANPAGLVSGSCFQQIETPVTPIPPGGEAFFRVRLLCPAAGTVNGAVTILSNDADESPYDVALVGSVTP